MKPEFRAPSLGHWIEDQRSSGVSEEQIDTVIAIDQRLRAAMVVCQEIFDVPTQKTVIAVFERICQLALSRQKLDGLAMPLTDHTSDQGEHGPRIALGRVVITDAASGALEAAQEEGVALLARHLHGDWGDLPEPDLIQNELAVLLGLQVRSCYTLKDSKRIWIITEADRSVTTMLLADIPQE